jgi:hypothetical protein
VGDLVGEMYHSYGIHTSTVKIISFKNSSANAENLNTIISVQKLYSVSIKSLFKLLE